VRSIYAGWERGDWSSVELADPEIGLVFAGGPGRGSWRGLAAMAEGWRDSLGNWEDWSRPFFPGAVVRSAPIGGQRGRPRGI
jgi:hypothetical protein